VDPTAVPMYQGEDWSQQLSFFEDVGQTTPVVFTDPVMDIRTSRARLATFDTSGSSEGLAAIVNPGVLLLSMDWEHTKLIKAGIYPLDIFAEVAGQRRAITKVGTIQLVVAARVTQDEHP
jgi:hypothetical protein